MSPLKEIGLVAQRELRKSFRSAKGIVLLGISLLGGTAATLGLVKLQQLKREKLGGVDAETIRSLREQAYTELFGDATTGKTLSTAPEVLMMVLILTVWLTPLLVSLLAFDSVSADLQNKGVRYWSMRTRRWAYFVGKWAGVWATLSIMTFTMHFLIWGVCIFRGEATAGEALGWGVRFWVITLPIGAAWSGIATLVSSLFKSPIIALLTTFAAFFVLFLFYIIGSLSHADALAYVYPNFYEEWLMNARLDRWLSGLGACLAMAALYVGGGSFLFAKKDV